jgi:hypothetical protein
MALTTITARLDAVVLDATAPSELARFWARALRWDIGSADEETVELVPTDSTSFRLLIQRHTNEKTSQNRIHFDLTTTSLDDQDRTVAELLAMGAAHVDIGQDPNDAHVVLADPEGNEFCIIEPFNRFLSSCPRLGAVNCDGTRALGHFYSEALGWPLVWDQDEETAIQAPAGTGPKITWSGPPLMPRLGRDRFHLHVAAKPPSTAQVTVDRFLALGAAPLDVASACGGAIVLSDVDGNHFCLVES